MELLSKLPGRVVLSDRRPPNFRHGRSKRSMVDGLMRQSCASIEASMCCSPCCLSTFTISGRNGCNRFEHSLSVASQTNFSASAAPVAYSGGRPRRLTAWGWLIRFNNLIAALRCQPVTCVNSSNILPFSSFDALKYRLRNAWAYSNILRRGSTESPRSATFTPPFGNTNFDATTPLSVTFIMTQCEYLILQCGYNRITK